MADDRSFVPLTGGAGHFDQTGLNERDNPAQYQDKGKRVDLPADFAYSTDFKLGYRLGRCKVVLRHPPRRPDAGTGCLAAIRLVQGSG